MSSETLTVRCPQCGGQSIWSPENPDRPFCSKRCKLIDLGAWASESYRVPVEKNGDSQGNELDDEFSNEFGEKNDKL